MTLTAISSIEVTPFTAITRSNFSRSLRSFSVNGLLLLLALALLLLLIFKALFSPIECMGFALPCPALVVLVDEDDAVESEVDDLAGAVSEVAVDPGVEIPDLMFSVFVLAPEPGKE